MTSAMRSRATWKDAYDAQIGLWRWLRTDYGDRWLHEHYALCAKGLSGDVADMLATLYSFEVQRVLAADPFFVSAGMCQVVEAASETFKPEAILPTDLLTSQGFVYFERPFEILDRFDEPTTFAGFSWQPMISAGDAAERAAVLRELQDGVPTPEWFAERRRGKVDGLAITIYASVDDRWDDRLPPPPVVPMHLTPWWFGMDFEGNDVDVNDVPTGAAWWWKIAQVTLRLMQQQISARHPERADRAQRRGAERLGFPDREVVVVRLRREQADPREPSGEAANYSHRFIVDGHWRNQWYAASGVHRQIWISPFIKGDESLPLVVKPRRAFVWTQ